MPIGGPGVTDQWPTAQTVGYGLIGFIIGANLQSTADQPLTMTGVNTFVPDKIIVRGNTGTPLAAAGAIYTAASKGGTPLMNLSQTFLNATGPTAYEYMNEGDLASNQDAAIMSTQNLYLSLMTPNVAAATADFFVYGRVLS